MLSASKSTVNLKNLKILKPKVTKNVTNLPKKVCEFRPWSFYGPFLFLARNLEVIQWESDNTANHWCSISRKKFVHCSICVRCNGSSHFIGIGFKNDLKWTHGTLKIRMANHIVVQIYFFEYFTSVPDSNRTIHTLTNIPIHQETKYPFETPK